MAEGGAGAGGGPSGCGGAEGARGGEGGDGRGPPEAGPGNSEAGGGAGAREAGPGGSAACGAGGQGAREAASAGAAAGPEAQELPARAVPPGGAAWLGALMDDVSAVGTVYALYLVAVILGVFVPMMAAVSGLMGGSFRLALAAGAALTALAHAAAAGAVRRLARDRGAYDGLHRPFTAAGLALLALVAASFGWEGAGVVLEGLAGVAVSMALLYLLIRLTRSGAVVYAFMLVTLSLVFVGLAALLEGQAARSASSGLAAPLDPLTGSVAWDALPLFALNGGLLGVEVALALGAPLPQALRRGAAGGAALAASCAALLVWLGPALAPAAPSVLSTPIVMSSYLYPGEGFRLEGAVSARDGPPVAGARVAVEVLCAPPAVEGGCAPGEAYPLGPSGEGRTDDMGNYALELEAPSLAGEYELALRIEPPGGGAPYKERARFTVG